MLPPEARQLTADFSPTPKKPTHQTPKKPQFTVKKDILSQSTSLALGDPELENISITQTITKVNLESQKPFNKTPQKNQQTPARTTSGSGKKLSDRHRTLENETKSSKDADGACGRDEIDQTVTVPDEKIILSEKDVLNLIKPEGAQSPFTPEPNENRRRKPKKQTPAESQDSAQDEVCEPRGAKADVINSPKVEQTAVRFVNLIDFRSLLITLRFYRWQLHRVQQKRRHAGRSVDLNNWMIVWCYNSKIHVLWKKPSLRMMALWKWRKWRPKRS